MSHQHPEMSGSGARDAQTAVGAMLESWRTVFQQLGWRERLFLLEQLDEHIEVGAGHGGPRISPAFTSRLIELIDGNALECREQAYIYLNSEKEIHHEIARVWLTIKDSNNPIVQPPRPRRAGIACEKRTAIRHAVDLPSLIVAENSDASAKLCDISSSGARIAVDKEQRPGSRVTLHMPLMEPIAASVVWFASAYIGVSFVSQQSAFPGLV